MMPLCHLPAVSKHKSCISATEGTLERPEVCRSHTAPDVGQGRIAAAEQKLSAGAESERDIQKEV